jgi:D-3-phosphoglycerate dehydrogenase
MNGSGKAARMKVYLSHGTLSFPGYFGERALEALREHADVVRNPGELELRDEALAAAAAGCDAIIAYRGSPGTAATFAAAPQLKAFLRCAVDISTVDVAAASAQGILVTQATPGFVDAVVELGVGFMVDLARGVSRSVLEYRAGGLAKPRPGLQLSGATLGLVGYGRIARRLAEVARAMGMQVLAYDPHGGTHSLAEVLSGADIVVCLALSTPQTRHMMGAEAFAAMRRGAFFINLSRGELIDDAALEAALDAGHLAGAAMDVGNAPDQMPEPRLAARPDVIATPHIGGLTPAAAEHQAMDTVRQIAALAAGRLPDGAVNAAQAYRLFKPA